MLILLQLFVLTLTVIPSIRMEFISDSTDPKLLFAEHFTQLAKRIEELELKDKLLSKENEDLKVRIKALEDSSQHQHREIDRPKVVPDETIGSLANVELRPDISWIHKRVKTILRQPTTNQEKSHAVQRIRKANNEISVAFFSKLQQHLNNPGVHQTVVFENVVTNVGNAYNKYAGDFRAPENGIYVFSTTLLAATSAYPYHFQVMLNGSAVSNIYIENGGTASQEVILQLKQNDSVAIHSLDANHNLYGSGYSSFSGFLLQQTYEDVGIVGK